MGYYSTIMITTTQKGFEKIKKEQERFGTNSMMREFRIDEIEKNGKKFILMSTEESIKYYQQYEEVAQFEKSLEKIKDGYVFCRFGEEQGDIEFRNRSNLPELLDPFEFIVKLKDQLKSELEKEEEKNLNRYENIIIINPTLNQEERKEILNKYENLMKGFSNKEVEVEDLGKKNLAYEIKNNKTGYYAIFKFYSEPENIEELERHYRIDDNVMKFLTVRMEEEEEFNCNEEEEEFE